MTLCIAAECQFDGAPAVAMLTDWRAQTGDLNQPELMTGSDDLYKMREFRRATVLLAGPMSKALSLAAACKPAINEFTASPFEREDLDIAVDALMRKLERIAAERKLELTRNYIENSLGMTHEEFKRTPTDQHLEAWHEIRRLNLGADILIACVIHDPIIIRLDRYGVAHWTNNYGLIGNGSEVARAMLCLQSWEPSEDQDPYLDHTRRVVSLEECLYRISEAHIAAHRANPSSVGDVTAMQVITANHRCVPKPGIAQALNGLFHKKHVVPKVAKMTKELALCNFQSLDTGSVQSEAPDKL